MWGLEEDLVSGPCSDSELIARYRKVPLNSTGAEINDPTWPDGATLVDSAQGGADHRISLIMQPTRPGLTVDMRMRDGSKNPAIAKFDVGPDGLDHGPRWSVLREFIRYFGSCLRGEEQGPPGKRAPSMGFGNSR